MLNDATHVPAFPPQTTLPPMLKLLLAQLVGVCAPTLPEVPNRKNRPKSNVGIPTPCSVEAAFVSGNDTAASLRPVCARRTKVAGLLRLGLLLLDAHWPRPVLPDGTLCHTRCAPANGILARTTEGRFFSFLASFAQKLFKVEPVGIRKREREKKMQKMSRKEIKRLRRDTCRLFANTNKSTKRDQRAMVSSELKLSK